MKKSNFLPKIIFFIYPLYIFYLILCSVSYNIKTVVIVMGSLILLFNVFKKFIFPKINLKKVQKFLTNPKVIVMLFILALMLRLSFLLFKNAEFYNFSNDYATYFQGAKAIAKGSIHNPSYIAFFPFIFSYMAMLGGAFALFKTSFSTVLILNIIIDIIGAILSYLFIRRLWNKNVAIIVLLLWLFNPFSIIWCTTSSPIIAVNTAIMLNLYLFSFLVKNDSNYKKTIFLSLIYGLSLSLSNSLRPIMIIFIIATFICYISLVLKDKKRVKHLVLSFITIILTFSVFNTLYIKVVSQEIGLNAATKGSGWSIYLGSNYDSKGAWFADSEFGSKLNAPDFDADELHSYYLQKGLDNYRQNGFEKNIEHFFNKSVKLGSGVSEITTATLTDFIYKDIITEKLADNLTLLLNIYFFSLLFINLYFKRTKFKNNESIILLLTLLMLGFYSSGLLVEVSPRYFMPQMVPLLLLTTFIIANQLRMKEN